ncbi:MAG: hypothetical protein ACRD1K_20610 [Acidimicrobiales bacterium]
MTDYRELLKLPNVVGAGRGWPVRDGELRREVPATIVLVREKLPRSILASSALIPRAWDGLGTDVVQTGTIRALLERTDRWRPAPGGVSIGHFGITAGTLGAVVRERAGGARVILSNNHVLANSNEASVGDPVLQPGPADGGRADVPSDVVALLRSFVPILFEGAGPPSGSALLRVIAQLGNWLAERIGDRCRLELACPDEGGGVNRVDAALALPPIDADVLDTILDIGRVGGTMAASIGLPVRKSGRTTRFTTGTVQLVDATVRVAYGAGRVALFEQQIVTSGMSAGGDSGSLLVAGDPPAAVGLLFAGSDAVTIFNPINVVLGLLGAEL